MGAARLGGAPREVVQSCPSCLQKQKSGFTLIELLVVVAIIGILFAVALPVFGNAGRKDTYRAAQQVSTTLRLARQHAIAKRQWTFVIFPNMDSDFSSNKKDINHVSKCLRSYAVIAVTNNMDKWRSNAKVGPVVNGEMYFEFVSDWKYLPEGIYFDDTPPGKGPDRRTGNYIFGNDGQNGYNPDATEASKFLFPYDPRDPNTKTKMTKMSAICVKPSGRYFFMQQSGNKHWRDDETFRLLFTSARFYDVEDNHLSEPVEIPGTNSVLQIYGKTGMVRIYEGPVWKN